MSKLQQDFWHPLFYFIHKDGLSTYDTTATPSDAYLRESFSAGEQYFDSFCQDICEKTEMIWEK